MYLLNMDRCNYPNPVSVICDVDLQRGQLLQIEGMAQNNIWLDNEEDFEAYKVALADADAEKKDLLIHTTVPFSYNETDTEYDFYLKAGKVGRGHYVNTGDEYTFDAELVEGVSAVGEEVQLAGDGKMKLLADGNAIGKVVRIYNFGGNPSVMIRFY